MDQDRPASKPIRLATSDDLAAVLDLAQAFYLEDGFKTSRDRLRTNLATLIDSSDAYVAVVPTGRGASGGLAAFAVTTTSFGLEDGAIAELEDLYVVADARGQGLGNALVADSAEWAQRRGCSYLEVVVADSEQRERLEGYYRRTGFAEPRTLLRRPVSFN